MLFLASATAALAFCGSGAVALAANTISGKVFDQETGEPIKGAEACLELTVDVPITCASSAADGSFELKPSSNHTDWVIRFSDAPGYFTSWYQGEPSFEDAERIDTTLGNATGLDQSLEESPRGSISGRVTTKKTGAPVAAIRVCALISTQYEVVACTQSAPDGTYSIGGLPTGSYKVAFNEPLPETFNSAYLSQLWQGATTFATATTIPLVAPESRAGIDATLQVPGETPEPSSPAVPATTSAPGTPPSTSTPPTPHSPAPLVCKKGFRREKVKGKPHCVRKRHHHKRSKHRHAPQRTAFPAPRFVVPSL
jgi:hypothetical protein